MREVRGRLMVVVREERRERERTGIGGLRRIQQVEGGGEKMQGGSEAVS
jgi:hypothetical protein